MNGKNILKAGISIACLVLLFHKIDTDSLQEALRQADPATVARLLALLCVLIFVQAIRWWLIGAKLGFKWSLLTATELAFVGTFFNQILPTSSGGDAVRAWELTRAGIPVRQAVSSVVLDRVSALIAIGLIFALGFPVLYGVLGKFMVAVDMSVLYVALPVALVVAAAAAWAYLRFPALRQSWILRTLGKLGSDAGAVFKFPLVLLATTALSLIIQILVGYIVWRLASDFGAKLDFIEFSLLWPAVLILSFLPISIAGWGIREGAMVFAFHILGNPSSIALATSIAFGVLMILAGLPGGVIWFFSSFRKHPASIELTKLSPRT